MVHIWTGVPHSISSPWQLATPHWPELGGLFCKTNTAPSAMAPNTPTAMIIFLCVVFMFLFQLIFTIFNYLPLNFMQVANCRTAFYFFISESRSSINSKNSFLYNSFRSESLQISLISLLSISALIFFNFSFLTLFTIACRFSSV